MSGLELTDTLLAMRSTHQRAMLVFDVGSPRQWRPRSRLKWHHAVELVSLRADIFSRFVIVGGIHSPIHFGHCVSAANCSIRIGPLAAFIRGVRISTLAA